MYKVYCNHGLVSDSNVDELALINPVINQAINSAGSFYFTMAPDHPNYDSFFERKSLVEVFQDDQLIFSGICIETEVDFFKRKKIYCEGDFTFFNDSVQRPARYQGKTVRELLEAFVNNHNEQVDDYKKFYVGQVTVTDPNDYIYCFTNMETTMQCFKDDLIENLGGFFRIRYQNGGKYIDYLAESPHTSKQVIKLGRNLLDLTSNIDSSEIATAIIPLGATLEESEIEGLETRLNIKSVNDGLDYVHSETAVENFGWIYKTVTFDDVTVAANLKKKGLKYLQETQFEKMVINAKAVDLGIIASDYGMEKFKIYDNIRVLSDAHGLDKFFMLTKMKIDLNNPSNSTITLGIEEKVGISAKAGNVSEAIRKAVESIVPASTILELAKDNATNLITGAMGGYVYKTNSELYIMDTNDPQTAQKVWRWNINGLGYSSTGIDGPYGLAMTMDGSIVADFIKAGTMYADRIKGGILALGGNNNDDGSIQIKDESGNVVGTWDNSGINATGSFSTQNNSSGAKASLKAGGVTLQKDSQWIGGIGTVNPRGSEPLGIEMACVEGSALILGYQQSSGGLKASYFLNVGRNPDNHMERHIFYDSVRHRGPVYFGTSNTYLETRPYDGSEAIVCSNGIYAFGSMGCSGTKYRVVDTEHYGKRGMNAMESAEAFFSDLGSVKCGSNGIAEVVLDEIFLETIEGGTDYFVQITNTSNYEGWVEKLEGKFRIHSVPDASFDWIVYCKQKGFANVRMNEVVIEEPIVPEESEGE